MKALALIVATSLATTTAVAQQTRVTGGASAESQTSVAADRRGANVASENRVHGNVATQQGRSGDADGAQGAANVAGGSEMNATLERSVDARRARPGDEVTAKMNEDFTTESGTTIPRGTRIVGRVTEARPHTRGEGAAASQLGIVFDKAVLDDGREVPMQATIGALAAGRSRATSDFGSASHEVAGGAFGAAHGSGGGLGGGGFGGLGGAAHAGGGLAGNVAGSASGAIGGATRLPRPAVGTATSGAAAAASRGNAVLGTSAGAVGGLSASGQWLAGSRGVFGLDDLSIASHAAGSAQGSVITSAARNVRLDGGTQLLLVGNAGATSR